MFIPMLSSISCETGLFMLRVIVFSSCLWMSPNRNAMIGSGLIVRNWSSDESSSLLCATVFGIVSVIVVFFSEVSLGFFIAKESSDPSPSFCTALLIVGGRYLLRVSTMSLGFCSATWLLSFRESKSDSFGFPFRSSAIVVVFFFIVNCIVEVFVSPSAAHSITNRPISVNNIPAIKKRIYKQQ